MSTLRVYRATMPSVNFIMPNGKPIIFQQGVYYTDKQNEIDTLDFEIKQGHPHIFVDPTNAEIASEDLDPVVAMKKKVLGMMTREQLLDALKAREAEVVNPSNDLGESDQSAVKPASTQDIAPAAAGGPGAVAGAVGRLDVLDHVGERLATVRRALSSRVHRRPPAPQRWPGCSTPVGCNRAASNWARGMSFPSSPPLFWGAPACLAARAPSSARSWARCWRSNPPKPRKRPQHPMRPRPSGHCNHRQRQVQTDVWPSRGHMPWPARPIWDRRRCATRNRP